MAQRTQPPPSAMDKEYITTLGFLAWSELICRLIIITMKLALKIVRGALGGPKKDLSLRKYAALEALRDYQSGLSPVQIQNALPSTSKTCAKMAKRHGIVHSVLHLPDGAVASRLGASSSSSKKISKAIMFCHGGGYMSPMLPEHFLCAVNFADKLPKHVAVFILQYGLASEGGNHYPRQLQQAASLLDHILHVERLEPSAITLAGDSAGAHLTLSLLLHLTHPHPQVKPITLNNGQHLSGAALISPWIMDADSQTSSMTQNDGKDALDPTSLRIWIQNFMHGAPVDPWASPLMIPPEWFETLVVDDILVTYGENEVLRDDIAKFCASLQAGHPLTVALEMKGEWHAHILLNRALHLNEPCESERVYREWLGRHIREEETS